MSTSIDQERAEDAHERRMERAKQALRDLQTVLTLTYQGMQVAEQARRLTMSRDRIRWMQRVLGLRNGRLKSGWASTRVGSASTGMMEAG